jgi:NAD(P)-dependent dehydrogenase (short-subunit alcohol dehydrogenase family)
MTNLFDVHGKVALVTGGTRGIGFMIARGLAEAGVRTYVVSRKAKACAEAEHALGLVGEAIGMPADLSDPEALQRFAAAFSEREPKLHILVNNAGAAWGAPFGDFPRDGWDKVMRLNLDAVFFLTQALIDPIAAAAIEDDPARVINIGSIDGLAPPHFENYPYSAAKAGLHHLTRHLARHLAPRNISVNAIAPGYFPTKMTSGVLETDSDQLLAAIPQRRMGKDADAAGLAIFLSSRASAYITGATIPLDGGYSTSR